jgi:outer membrane protein
MNTLNLLLLAGAMAGMQTASETELQKMSARFAPVELRADVSHFAAAEGAVAVSERAVDAARENEKVSRDRYREGVASSSDLLDAEVKSLRAALDRTDARARLLLARTNLDRAVGRLR